MKEEKLNDEFDQYAPSKAYQKLFSKGKSIRKNYRYENFRKHILSKRLEAYMLQIEEEKEAFRILAFEKVKPIFQTDDQVFFHWFKQWENDKELQDGYPKIFNAFVKEAEYRDFENYLNENNHKLRHITFIDYE